MIRCLVIALILSFCCTVQAQKEKFQLSFMGDEDKITVPFKYTQGFIILDVNLNGRHQLNLILDTGAENVIFFKYSAVENYNLAISKNIQLVGSDLEEVVEAVICRRNKIKLKKGVAIINDVIVLKEDILSLDQITGQRIDGILGGRAFWGQTIELDYIRGELTIYKNKAAPDYASDLQYQAYPVSIENHKPYINLTYRDHKDEPKPVKVLLDTGSALGLLLFSHADSTVNLPPKHIRTALGKGIGGDILGYIGRLPRVELSEVHFLNNIIAYFQDIDEAINPDQYAKRLGLLGNPVLSRFYVVIDYLDNVVYLKVNQNFNDEFEHDLSGLQIFASGRFLTDFVVNAVYETSPAEAAGFEKGDIIRRVGFLGSNLMSMASLSNKLSKREGKKLRIVIKRDGKKLVKRITLKDYLSL